MSDYIDNFTYKPTGTYAGTGAVNTIWAGQGMPPGYLENFDFSAANWINWNVFAFNYMTMEMPGQVIFNSSQFGAGLIAPNLTVYGAIGHTTITINMNSSSFNGSQWTFMQNSPSMYNWFPEAYVAGDPYYEADTIYINGSSNNSIVGTYQRDVIAAGIGSNVIDGGLGSDTLILQGSFASYKVASNGSGGFILTNAARSETDNASNIDLYQFSDQTITSTDLQKYITPIQTFYATTPNQTFNGNGEDIVVFSGPFNQYNVSHTGKVWYVTDTKAGGTGTDTLNGIGTIDFSSGHLALINPPITVDNSTIYRLYQAAFARVPDEAGDVFWVNSHNQGVSINDISQSFLASPEFIKTYGANLTNAQYVNQLYLNVLGRPGEAGGVAYWNGILDSGKATRSQVLTGFADAAENVVNTATHVDNGYFFL